MGIKESKAGDLEGGADEEAAPAGAEVTRKQSELFNQLDREYQLARIATHTHRGVGLGFGGVTLNNPVHRQLPPEDS